MVDAPRDPHQARDWSSDEIWNLVKDRISEHLAIIKWCSIALCSIASLFVTLILAILSIQDIRAYAVKHWIVDVDASVEDFMKRNLEDRMSKFIDGRPQQLVAMENDQIDRYLDNVVAYSYAASFQLSGGSTGQSAYVMPLL
jgi:hypothetical protein